MSITGISTMTLFRLDDLVLFTEVGIRAGLAKQPTIGDCPPVLSFSARIGD